MKTQKQPVCLSFRFYCKVMISLGDHLFQAKREGQVYKYWSTSPEVFFSSRTEKHKEASGEGYRTEEVKEKLPQNTVR